MYGGLQVTPHTPLLLHVAVPLAGVGQSAGLRHSAQTLFTQ
jgi:hypothetical protein